MAVSDDFGTHKPVKINTFTEFSIFKKGLQVDFMLNIYQYIVLDIFFFKELSDVYIL